MKKNFLLKISALLLLSSYAHAGSFNCSNPPAAKWGTYICASGDISDDGKTITNMAFGTCEGSQRDGESEPVDIFDFDPIHHDPSLAAKSSQWKNAGAFDVTTELGQATFYYVPGSDIARVKTKDGDIRLSCY